MTNKKMRVELKVSYNENEIKSDEQLLEIINYVLSNSGCDFYPSYVTAVVKQEPIIRICETK